MLAEHPCILGDEEALFFVDKISAGAERALNLTSDLLDLAQIEAGLALHRENLSAAIFIEECVFTVEYLARTRQITLTYEPPPEDILIRVDKRKMTQVMNNLLSNALKYTPENGHVEVTAGREGDTLYIRITDTGVGIPAADIPRIFEKFYRVPRRDYIEIEGTGLGLAIARSIVEAHDGAIWAESPNETGTTFCVQLQVVAG
jgi:two-component system sensor histidine kinase VicK